MCADGRCGHFTKPGENKIPQDLLNLMNEMKDFLIAEAGVPEVVAKLVVLSTVIDAVDAVDAVEAKRGEEEGLAA